MSRPPIVRSIQELPKFAITPGDRVKLALLAGPADGSPTSVFLEVWEPNASQPDNSHTDSCEIFVILSGRGKAYSDEHEVELAPGDVLVLAEGSVHRIENSSATERMYALTVMATDAGAMDGGFAELVSKGLAEPMDSLDLTTLFASRSIAAHSKGSHE
jgi:mannose-6-phosphate isomerase-like protein (cupin superfamily)